MITKQYIISLAEDFLKESDRFIVDVNVLPGNKIEVFIDAPTGLSIADCVNLSRHIEGSLDRDQEDVSLEVSSPGATEPFKVLGQFKKYTGKDVETHTLDGQTYKGKLVSANDEGITIETTRRENKTMGKGKQTVVENITLTYKQLKETKSVLPF